MSKQSATMEERSPEEEAKSFDTLPVGSRLIYVANGLTALEVLIAGMGLSDTDEEALLFVTCNMRQHLKAARAAVFRNRNANNMAAPEAFGDNIDG